MDIGVQLVAVNSWDMWRFLVKDGVAHRVWA